MNGVRRFLGGGATKAETSPPPMGSGPSPINTTMPLFSQRGPAGSDPRNWPPMTPGTGGDSAFSPQIASSVYSPTSPGGPSTTPLGLKNLARVPPPLPEDAPRTYAPPAGVPPLNLASNSRDEQPRKPPLKGIVTTIRAAASTSSASTSSPVRGLPELDARDEMVISLLASDAVIDSRDMQVLSFEEVEQLKKEQQTLSSRFEAQTKKLALETRIRDAASSLQNLNSTSKQVSKPTSDQLDAANRKVDTAQKELYRISDRLNEVRRSVLEHRTAVLSLSLRSMEAKARPPVSASHHDSFDGAHLFAGNDDSVLLEEQHLRSSELVKDLERQLRAARERETELSRNLGTTTMDRDVLRSELDAANDRVADLQANGAAEDEIARMREENEMANKLADEYADARDAIQAVIRSNRIVTPISKAPSLTSLVAVIMTHVDSVSRRLDDALSEHDQLTQDVDTARKEREQARRELAAMRAASPPTLSTSPPTFQSAGDDTNLDKVLAALRGVWPMLPSPEARARKTGLKASSSPMRPKSPSSPSGGRAGLDEANSSLSDLDVRQLKALYDPRNAFPSPGIMGEFSVDTFVDRVQALLVDDRALIERLIRFAKSHDHLRTNAERAQKLAQESTAGLETYARQVKGLEERSTMLMGRTTELTNELSALEAQLHEAVAARSNAEQSAMELSEMCRTLRDANEALKGKAADPAQIADMAKKLKEAEDELDRYRTVQETQRIALLDELNELQKNNSQLRDQLRARR